MKTNLQSRISPLTQSAGKDINGLNVSQPNEQEGKIDFKQLLMDSNDAILEKKEADSKGKDLSKTKSYDEFLETLSNNGIKKNNAPRNTLGKDDFLRLFVTQLQFQDPLNPKDGDEMAAQLAQFNSLEQMMNVNKTLERMEVGNKSDRNFSLLNSIGKEALVKDGKINFVEGKASEVSFKTPLPILNAKLKVTNSDAKVVFEKDLGPFQGGDHTVSWDGTLNDASKSKSGVFSLSVVATNDNNDELPLEVSKNIVINGIDFASADSPFVTDDGNVSLESIIAIKDKKKVLPAAPEKEVKPVAGDRGKKNEANTALGSVQGEDSGVAYETATNPAIVQALLQQDRTTSKPAKGS